MLRFNHIGGGGRTGDIKAARTDQVDSDFRTRASIEAFSEEVVIVQTVMGPRVVQVGVDEKMGRAHYGLPAGIPGLTAPPNLDLVDAVMDLQRNHDMAEKLLADSKGRLWDALKNNIGTSGREGGMWSKIIDSDLGSDYVAAQLKKEQNLIDDLRRAAKFNERAEFTKIYKNLTGKDYGDTD